jgi:hypothetical protein
MPSAQGNFNNFKDNFPDHSAQIQVVADKRKYILQTPSTSSPERTQKYVHRGTHPENL